MSVMYYFGDVPVQPEELKKQIATGNFFKEGADGKVFQDKVAFKEGVVHKKDLEGVTSPEGLPFTPIGIGKPLSLEIMATYVGDAPNKFLGGKRDIMLVSGSRSVHTQGASVRGLNLISRRVEDKQFIRPGAFDEGSRVVFYTPALDADSIHFSFDLIADTFPQQTFSDISKLFTSAASLPIFVPAASFMLAGGVVAGLAGKLGNAFDTPPFMKGNLTLEIRTPGEARAIPGRMIIYDDQDRQELLAYRAGHVDGPGGEMKPALVHRQTGEIYSGNAPYLLINVDGSTKPQLNGFVLQAATVAQLNSFYGKKQPGAEAINVLKEAMSLYNDLSYSRKIEMQQDLLAGITDTSSEAYLNGQMLLEAYRANLRSDAFKKFNKQ